MISELDTGPYDDVVGAMSLLFSSRPAAETRPGARTPDAAKTAKQEAKKERKRNPTVLPEDDDGDLDLGALSI